MGKLKRITKITCGTMPDEDPDLSFLKDPSRYEGDTPENIAKYEEQDAQRLAAFDRGEWGMVGVSCEAEIVVGNVIQRIRSGGLWGIEDDSDSDYIDSVKAEEFDALGEQLEALGFSKKDIMAHEPSEIKKRRTRKGE